MRYAALYIELFSGSKFNIDSRVFCNFQVLCEILVRFVYIYIYIHYQHGYSVCMYSRRCAAVVAAFQSKSAAVLSCLPCAMPCRVAFTIDADGSRALELHLPLAFCFQVLVALSSCGSISLSFVLLDSMYWRAFELCVVIALACAMASYRTYRKSKKPGSKVGKTTFGQGDTEEGSKVGKTVFGQGDTEDETVLDQAQPRPCADCINGHSPRNLANPTLADEYVMDLQRLHHQGQPLPRSIVCRVCHGTVGIPGSIICISKHGDKYHKHGSHCAKEYAYYTACQKCFR